MNQLTDSPISLFANLHFNTDFTMVCGILPILASLLSSAVIIDLNVDYAGTHERQNFPALYFNDIGSGTLNVSLPKQLAVESFVWNGTNATGADVLYNTSLSSYTFR